MLSIATLNPISNITKHATRTTFHHGTNQTRSKQDNTIYSKASTKQVTLQSMSHRQHIVMKQTKQVIQQFTDMCMRYFWYTIYYGHCQSDISVVLFSREIE